MLSYAALILNTTTLLLMSADDSWNGPDDPETGPSEEVAKTGNPRGARYVYVCRNGDDDEDS